MLSDWPKTQKKPTRTNQIRDVLTTKIQENGHKKKTTKCTRPTGWCTFVGL